MKNTMRLLCVLSLFLAGCAAEEVIVDTPTVQPTATLAPPTQTPRPTITPTPTPTPEPTLVPVDVLIEEIGFDDMGVLMAAEVEEFQNANYRKAIGLSSVIIKNWLEDYPFMYFQRAGSYAKLGDFEHAIKDLEKAAQLPYMDQFQQDYQDMDAAAEYYTSEEIEMISNLLNNLCWYLAITNQPDQALPYCDEAAAIFPSAPILDSRAVVYGMLGRTEDAIKEFEQVLLLTQDDPFGLYTEMNAERQQWITLLQNGQSPFTPELLEQLRQDTIDHNALPEPELLEDYSGEHFVQVLEDNSFGLVESGVNDSGYEYSFYGRMAGKCASRVILFEPEREFSEAKMILNGCSLEQYIAELRWFAQFLLLNDPNQAADCISMGEWQAWELTELLKLLAGEIENTEEFSLRQFNFYAEAEVDSDDDLWVTIYGY